MNKKIWIKEVFLKNDLSYLTLSYFLFMFSFSFETLFSLAPLCVGGGYLAVGWYFSLKTKNIFNTPFKLMVIPALFIWLMNSFFLTQANVQFSGFTSNLGSIMFTLYTLIVIYVSTCLIPSKKDAYYAVFEANCRKLETEYLRHTYRSMAYNNEINYHYDDRVNLYMFDDSMHAAGDSWFVKEECKTVIGSLPDYYSYLKELNIDYDSMNKDSLEVFKMYAI